jgi:hypothetical protein
VLYEAMRVGAADGTVLGTIHGGGGESVRERVVTDLGVPESAFADTDLVVTVEAYDGDSGRTRRLRTIETVRRESSGVGFGLLYDADGGIDRLTDDDVLEAFCDPMESPEEVRREIDRRQTELGA